MNELTKALLGGVALSAVAASFASAHDAPKFHLQALHAGKQVNKTALHNQNGTHLTYTFAVYTYVASSEIHKTVPLIYTYYRWTYSGCTSGPPVRVRAPKKSEYGKIGIATETYTGICGPGIKSVFYGNTYKLTNPKGDGKTDGFVATQIFKYRNGSKNYKGTLNLDVKVTIEELANLQRDTL